MFEKEVKNEVADMAEVLKVTKVLNNQDVVDDDPWAFWNQWREGCDDKTFLGFVDDGMPQNLVAGKTYGFEIGPVALVGDCLQMLVMILEATDDGRYVYDDRPVGLLLECYKLGSEEFKEMARGVYAGGYKTIIDVHIDRIGEAYGTIEVKEKDGKFALDWRKFVPKITPCGEGFMFCEHIAEKIEESKLA